MSVTEVAKRSGVSRMTVSRVINNDPRVNPDTARLVRKIIADLNYVPPSAEEDGRRRRSRSVSGLHTSRIVVLIPDTNPDAMRTTLSGRLLHGIDGPTEKNKLQMILARLPAAETLPRSIDRRQTDGVIVRYGDPPWLAEALKDIPCVWVFDGQGTGAQRDRVNVDNTAVGRLAADYLSGRGHRCFAAVDGNPRHPAHVERVRAFCAQAEQSGTPVLTLETDPRDADAMRADLQKLLSSRKKPTGLFLPGSGPFISRTQHAVRAAGFRPGEAIDLIGCGHNRDLIEAMYPQPANIDIQPEAIGEAAVELLLWRLAHPDDAHRCTLIQPKIVLPEPAGTARAGR